jgi:NitT/TauT family transport system permease protein
MRPRESALTMAGVVLVFGLAITAWQVLSTDSSTFFFSKPSEIVQAVSRGIVSGDLARDALASGKATVWALLLGAALGAGFALPASRFPTMQRTAKALVLAVSALPILAVAPMFLIWFGTGVMLKVALGAVLAALIIAAAVLQLDDVVDADLIAMLRTNRIGRPAIFWKVTLPLGTRFVLARAPDAANAAFLGVFVGEFIAADRGIGYRILRSGSLYQTDAVWASTLSAVVMLIVLQLILWSVRRTIVKVVERLSVDRSVRAARMSAHPTGV